ncbi:helix-turn-helix transcriptional regulator [Mycolicibacterium mengxianglii]|uniref:helix-turn-helix transcriptional regulator n=1 Tax=Mycolicibacterium mengxianglii TaxID=2736649 RepID=UPI001E605541|nr:helix-turn-helix domain-containing protein [Mycolicibacterium mengxianglii]
MSERLTLKEASEYLRVPVGTLRWFRQCGTGPTSYVLGRRVFYDPADLERWVDAQKVATRRGDSQ